MLDWIYQFPAVFISALFALIFIGATLAGIFLLRPIVRARIHSERRANDMVGFALSSFSVLYGILLGLLAVASYQNFSTVVDVVDKEGSSIAALYRDFSAYPPPIRDKLQDELRDYVRYTIEEGWPQQRRGVVPSGGSRVSTLFEMLMTFEPNRKSEEILHTETLRQFDKFIEIRRSRLANVIVGLPAVFWWVVALGAVINIGLIWMLDMEVHVHAILGGALACFLGVVIFLIAALDSPFRGAVSIGPDAISLVYETLMKPR